MLAVPAWQHQYIVCGCIVGRCCAAGKEPKMTCAASAACHAWQGGATNGNFICGSLLGAALFSCCAPHVCPHVHAAEWGTAWHLWRLSLAVLLPMASYRLFPCRRTAWLALWSMADEPGSQDEPYIQHILLIFRSVPPPKWCPPPKKTCTSSVPGAGCACGAALRWVAMTRIAGR